MTEFLSLTKLDYFPIAEEVTFRAIGALCPFLENVMLCGFNSESENHSRGLDQRSVMITPEKLNAALKDWPKVSLFLFSSFFVYSTACLLYILMCVCVI